MIIKFDDSKIRYTGRWNIGENSARTTACGNYFEFMFKGECAVLGFDVSNAKMPFPKVYISVDGGANIESTVDRFIRIFAEEGVHKVQVTMKCSLESQQRWYEPLESVFSLIDIEADEFINMPDDTRPTIEFIGDSITEGSLVDYGQWEKVNQENIGNLIYCNDSMADYTWLLAKQLDFRPLIMGYGSLGLTKGGSGGVPPVAEAYKYYSDGYPIESCNADYIIINHGTNDMYADKELYKAKYLEFLSIVRERNAKSKIIAITPFGGYFKDEIKEVVEEFNKNNNDDVFYINASEWVPKEPMHPLRDGHKTIAKKLCEIFRNEIL